MNTLRQKSNLNTDFEYIFNISPDLIFILDNDLNIVNVNQTAADRLGVTVESIIGTKCFSLMHRQDEMPESCPCGKFSEDQREHKAEFFLEQFQGWFSVTVKPLMDKEGNRTGSLHVAHDITGRKIAEEKLDASEQFNRSLFNMMNGFAFCKMIYEQDQPVDFIYLKVNQAFEKLTGLSDVEGKRISEVIPDILSNDPEILRTYGRVALSGNPETFERYLKSLDMWFSVSVFSPEKEHFVALFDVITERKRVEENLQKSEDLYKSFFRFNSANLLLVDPVTGQITDANPAACQFYGWTHDDLCSRSIFDLNTMSRADVATEIHKAIEQEITHFFFEHRLANGETRDVEVYSTPINYRNSNLLCSIVHDVTERKRAEAALQERERNLRAIFNATDESIFLLSADSTIIALNEVAAARLGTPSKELIGKKSYDILPPDLIATRRPYIEQALTTGRHISFDDERNGRLLVNHLHPIVDASGSVTGLSIYSRDITWRREAEIALKENEQKYRQLVDNSPDAIFIYVDGKIVFANRESLRLLAAADLGELIGKPVIGFVHPDCRSLVMERMQNATVEGVVLPLAEEKFIRLDGSEVEAEVVALAVRYENKPAVQLIIREITERKKSEKALIRSEERLREVLENSLDATYKSDLQTNRYDYMSPVYSQLTGFALDEILSMSVEDLTEKIHPGDRQKLMEAWDQARAGDAANEYQLDYRFRHKDGEYRWFHNKSHLLRNESGKPIARIGSISDITSRKQVEKELQESETRLQGLFDTMDEGVILINPDGQIVKANLAAEHILGISRSGIESRSYISSDWTILRVDGSPMPPEEMAGPRAMMEKQPVKDMVMGVCRPDGIVSWISVSATPMLNSLGELEGIVGTFANITKRKHAEDAVKAMALRNLTLLQTATDGIHVLDEVGNVVEANPAFGNMLGYTRDEMLKLNVRDWDMNWSDDQLQAKIDELLEQPGVFDTRHRRKDGTFYDVEINAVSVSLEGRKYLYNAARDISGRKRAEEFLEQTRNNYESFFNTIDELLFVLDTQGNIIYTNKTVLDRLGYSSEELAGQSVLMVHPPERREEAGRIVGEMLAGVTEFCPVPLITKTGVQIPVETRVSNGFWDSKPVIFGVSKDISKVKFSEEKFSKIFFLNPSACGLSDITTMKYVEVNDAFTRLFGYEKQEVIGKSSLEMGIIDAETRIIILQKADSNGKVTNVEATLKGKHGVIKHVLLSAENIYVQDQQYRFTLVHDITEIKKAEQEIKLINMDLIKLNAEKDKFFSIIAHDLRNPFNSLLGFSQMLVEDLPSLTAEDIQKIAVTLRNSVTRLYSLLENLLEWSRMQRGQISFNPVSFVLSQGIVSGIELVHEASEKKNIRINSHVPKDLVVLADEQMFKSVVRNLVFNAVKFTPANGMIAINAKMVPGNFVQISITDTGIGMNRLILENLFLLDNQVNRKGTDGEPSTGLGLIICRDFIEKHGGRIWAESEEGKGATFYFTLPANE